MKRPLVCILALFCTFSLYAQSLVWDIDFSTKFDNREYAGFDDLNPSKTLFASFLMPKIGFELSENHSFMTGLDLRRDFGDYQQKLQWNLLLYYKYDSDTFKAHVGVFPTSVMIGSYSTAFFNDDIFFGDTNFEGVALQYFSQRGNIELVFDWLKHKSVTDREIFALYSAARYDFGRFFWGYTADMTHFAGSELAPNVVDNILSYPYIGLNLATDLSFDKFELSAGWLQSFQHDRLHKNCYVFPSGGMFDLKMEKCNIGIKNSLFFGDNMMPYYYTKDATGTPYADWLYFGELFYSTDSGLYDRLEAYWNIFKNDYVTFSTSFVFNFDAAGRFGWQQKANLSVNLNNKQYGKK